jgi:hypothetical protein
MQVSLLYVKDFGTDTLGIAVGYNYATSQCGEKLNLCTVQYYTISLSPSVAVRRQCVRRVCDETRDMGRGDYRAARLVGEMSHMLNSAQPEYADAAGVRQNVGRKTVKALKGYLVSGPHHRRRYYSPDEKGKASARRRVPGSF